MATHGSGRAPQPAALTALPRLEDLPVGADGFDQEKVRDAFEAFRRHVIQLQAQLRVLQAAGRSAQVEPTGHAMRMDALHLIRAAAEFADTLERDAQNASAAQLRRTEEEVRARQRDLQQREGDVDKFRQESERQRAEILNAARNEARELLANAHREATQELREAEARGARLLEQSRHQATELTNAARAEVEQTLEWARAQAGAIMARAQHGAEQLLTAAGLGSESIAQVVNAIVTAADAATEAARGPAVHRSLEAAPPPASSARPDQEPVAEEASATDGGPGGAAPPPETTAEDREAGEPESKPER